MKIIKKSNNFRWIVVDNIFSRNMDNNLPIVGTCIHDNSSTYYTNKMFEELSLDIMNVGGLGIPILYTSDFNACIGNLSDYNYQATRTYKFQLVTHFQIPGPAALESPAGCYVSKIKFTEMSLLYILYILKVNVPANK